MSDVFPQRPDQAARSSGARAAEGPSWIVDAADDTQPVVRYLDAIKAGRWIIVGAIVVCLVAAALYLSRAAAVYEATTDILVTPQSALSVPVSGVVTQSNDPTRDIETIARLVESPSVARRVRSDLQLDTGIEGLLGRVSAQPIAQSNIVAVVGSGPDPEQAKQVADAFAAQFVAQRNEVLRRSLEPQIEQLRASVAAAGADANSGGSDSPQSRLQQLETLRQGGDPSVTVEAAAELPASPVAPRPLLTTAAALVGGAVLGLLGAFALQLLDPRLRREDQLRTRFRLPILTRLPLERRSRNRPLLPSELSIGALDGFQTLRAALAGDGRASVNARVVLITGPTPGDGKTTVAVNLASALAAAGKRTILVEADSRRPAVGRALEMQAPVGLSSVISGRSYLVDALLPVGEPESKLRVLLTSPDEPAAVDTFSSVSADTMLLQARRLADWVIIDAPPLNHFAETLSIARGVDDVVIVCRVGRSNVRELDELAQLFAQQDITPSGFVVVGGQARRGYY